MALADLLGDKPVLIQHDCITTFLNIIRVIWYQSSGTTVSSLPELAKFTSAQQFGSLLVCRAQINNIQLQVQD
eukprot:5762854-Ditylum_brightwellii.AAC.1